MLALVFTWFYSIHLFAKDKATSVFQCLKDWSSSIIIALLLSILLFAVVVPGIRIVGDEPSLINDSMSFFYSKKALSPLNGIWIW
jgi:hypothetical protein